MGKSAAPILFGPKREAPTARLCWPYARDVCARRTFRSAFANFWFVYFIGV